MEILHAIKIHKSYLLGLNIFLSACSWSPVWSFHSQWWFGLPCHLLVLVLCFLKSTINRHLPGHFRALHASSADKLYRDADYFSTCPQSQNHFQVVCWPWHYCAWLASQLVWPEPHREYMGYFQEKDEKQSIQQSRRATDSIVPQQSHRAIASMTLLTDAGVCAKGAPTKYWVHKSTYFKKLELFCFANPFFYYRS